ncbi:MAG: hypothetical protein ACD_38C00146G0025, partial [uncultured bacterium]
GVRLAQRAATRLLRCIQFIFSRVKRTKNFLAQRLTPIRFYVIFPHHMAEGLQDKLVAAEALQVKGGTDNWDQSIKAYEAIITEQGPSSVVLNGLGVPLRMRNRQPEAIATFTYARALALKERDLEAQLTAVNGLIDAWRTGNRCPTFPYPFYVEKEERLPYLHTVAQSFIPDTDAIMSQMRGLNLTRVEAYNQRGLLYNDMGDIEGALAEYREATRRARMLTETDPSNDRYQNRLARALTTMGVSLLRNGDVDGALAGQQESLGIYLQVDDMRGVGNAGAGVIDALDAKQDYAAARKLAKDLLPKVEQDPESVRMLTERLAKLPPVL